MVEAPGGDVDLTRTIAYLISERRAAEVAKSSYGARLGSISFQFTLFNFETRLRHRDPSYGLRSGSAPAICAVTIRLLDWLLRRSETHVSAIASASNRCVLHRTHDC